MDLEPTRAEEIAAACAELRGLGPFPPAIARGLDNNDPDQMRAAVTHLIGAARVDGLRALVERFWLKRDFGVWARVASSHLHRAAGEFAEGRDDIDDLIARFPARAAPHWWVAKARCVEGLGRGEEAVAAVLEGVARFPGTAMPQIFLANLLSRLKRKEEALQAWRDALSRFPEPELNWFVGLSNALKAVGRQEEAFATLEDGVPKFPDNPAGPPLLAAVAEDRHQWDRALALWQDFATRFAGAAEPQATLGSARALFRLDRVEEAVELLEALLAREPENIQALRERAWMAGEFGEAARARDCLIRLTRRFPEKSRPEWWASLARAHNDLFEHAAASEALAELERRFPESPLAEGERLRLAKESEHGHDDLRDQIAAALRRFPLDFNLRSHWIWILLSLGRLEEAERQVEALEADEAGGFALASRLRLEADRGDESLRGFVERFAPGREWTEHEAIQIAYALLDVRAPWAFTWGTEIVESLRKRFAGKRAPQSSAHPFADRPARGRGGAGLDRRHPRPLRAARTFGVAGLGRRQARTPRGGQSLLAAGDRDQLLRRRRRPDPCAEPDQPRRSAGARGRGHGLCGVSQRSHPDTRLSRAPSPPRGQALRVLRSPIGRRLPRPGASRTRRDRLRLSRQLPAFLVGPALGQ